MDTVIASPAPTSLAVEPAAHTPANAHPMAAPGEYLSLKLGAEEYGIDILRVQEIRSYEVPTRIANSPDYLKGVVNLRGVIVPVVDLRLKFALEAAEYNEFTVVIVLNVAHRVVGVVVDSVSDVIQLAAGAIRPAPEFSSSVDAGFITGIGTVKDGEAERMLILIDIENLIGACSLNLAERVH